MWFTCSSVPTTPGGWLFTMTIIEVARARITPKFEAQLNYLLFDGSRSRSCTQGHGLWFPRTSTSLHFLFETQRGSQRQKTSGPTYQGSEHFSTDVLTLRPLPFPAGYCLVHRPRGAWDRGVLDVLRDPYPDQGSSVSMRGKE